MRNYLGSGRLFRKSTKMSSMFLLLCILCAAAAPVMAQWEAERGSFRYAVVVREDTYQDPEWVEVVDSLLAKYPAQVFVYTGSIYDIQDEVGAYAPDYMAFVCEWNNATATFVDTVWKFGRGLDSDPYGDAVWGIITGYYASDALRLATGPEGFDVITMLGGTTSCGLTHYPQGISTSESTYGLYYTKALNEPDAVQHTDGPTDRTDWLVSCLNADSVNIFVTSGHGAHYQWQMHYPDLGDEGTFRSYGYLGVQAVGRNNATDILEINSSNPKIFFGQGNCQIGKIVNYNSMALGWLHTAGAYFYTGYIINEGSASQQHGGTKAYFAQQAHYTWPQAYYLGNQALYYDKYNATPGAAGAPDLNGSALYGDPAMEARIPDVGVYDDLLYSEEVLVDSSGALWEVTVRITMNVEGSPGYTSKWGNRSPIVLFPFRVEDITVVSHDCKDVVVTDNFALLHIWNKTEDPLPAAATREVTFTCNPLTGIIAEEEQSFFNCNLACSPNPFSGSTVISFNLPEQMQATLDIFDLSGRIVETLVDGTALAGSNTVVWGANSDNQIPDGVYICRLSAGSASYTSRMVYLR
ncbi:MAG: T9SS type A sorting domain-containing protein [Candidatus Sabulitectum sp.]|nr:T9SS type A sorting domain-containing protein [Candidatus Sabulitectum sp.]